MTTNRSFKPLICLLMSLAFTTIAHAGVTDISTVPLNTYSAPSSTDVKPNVLFILDDSGSMNWDFMPDWACASYSTRNSSCSSTGQDPSSARSEYLFRNAAYNGVYYSPAVTYTPPVAVDSSGTANTTAYPSMTGVSTTTGGDATATSGSPNWKSVKDDAYGIQSTSTSKSDLQGDSTKPPYFFTIVAGEYCTSASLKTCTTATAASTTYPFPAKVRWCSSSALTSCRAAFADTGTTFAYARAPLPRTATITVAGSSSTSVSGVTVNSLQIMSGTATASSTSSTVAQRVVDQINLCTLSLAGNCQTVGYTASLSGSVITITAPGAITFTPVVTKSGTMTFTVTAFAAGTVPGENLRTTLTSSVTSYSYPGTNAKAAARTDCVGTTCTYAEEMTNYANWWTYYKSRMQMMKTAASNAFSTIDTATDISNSVSRFRFGFMSINNNTGSDFLNFDEFKTTQKYNWYTKLISANPGNSTPLLEALANAGRLYAGKLNSTTFQGSTVSDPLQYSCQQNYTILSTDGFWNGNAGFKLNGSTAVGNQDAGLAPPYYDGGSVQHQTRTSILQSRTVNPQPQKRTSTLQAQTSQLQISTSNLQSQTSQLQSSTSNLQVQTSQLQTSTSNLQIQTGALQKRTSTDSGSNWTSWSNVASCTWKTSGGSRTQCQYNWGSWSNVSSCNASFSTNSSNNTTWSGNGTNCQYTAWTAGVGVSSCTAAAQSTGPSSYTVGTARQCQTVVTVPYANASSCTANATPNGSGNTTQCQYTGYSTPANTGSCTALAKSGSSPYTVGTATDCTYTAFGAFSNVSSCTPLSQSSGPNYTVGTAAQCQYTAWTNWANVGSCTPLAQSGSSPYTVGAATDCQSVAGTPGAWTNASSCTATSTLQCQYTTPTSWSNVTSCTAVAQSTSPNYTVATARDCQDVGTGGTSNTLADVAAYYYNTDLRDATAVSPNATGTCTGPTISPATTANDLCANNVPSSGRDVATTQHMTTFTLGLGSQGQMIYAPTDGKDYWNDTSGDFYDVKSGTSANSGTGVCSWQSSGSCNWPTPAANSNANIDDLWHAAVNGHGTYFSATDPASLTSSLTSTLTTIVNTPRPGTAAAAASSNPNVSSSDNYVFSSSYKSVEWYGELIRQQITATGTGALTAQNWSAMKLLDCATTTWAANTSYIAGNVYRQGSTCYTVTATHTSGATFDTAFNGVDLSNSVVVNVDETATPLVPAVPLAGFTTRTIYTKGTSALIPFQWGSLSGAQQAYFTKPAITYVSATVGLSQFCSTGGTCLSATLQNNNTIATGGAAGEALVNFLRGDRSNEGTYFRQRTHVLGDIVSSEARYVQAPLFNYSDLNYSAFKTAKASRAGTVYVAANDGMLHAFNATTGQESWAYIPSIVLPDLYKLADKNYSTQHQYFVDNSPETGDICPNATCTSSQWKTIIVGGLNRGGKGYYALDITDPAAPALLWEFTDTNLGYTYGNPKITKLKDGTWVVLVSAGYNNADGLGRLYVLNANTGAVIRSISTGVGSATTPSGMSRISAHVLLPMTDNTTAAAYGGDTLGNLWRFDINNDIGATGYDAQLLATIKDSSGNAQPITVKPLEATINGKPVVFVGTGKYLGTTDVTDTGTQSFYAVKDKLDATSYGNPRTASNNFVAQTFTSGTCPAGAPTTVCTPTQVVRTSSSNAVDWTTKNGWYIDFLTGGERSSTDPLLVLGSLMFTTISPQSSTVSACGATSGTAASFLYTLDYLTGGAVPGASNVSGVSLGSGLVTRPVAIELADGTVRVLIRTSSGASSGTDMGTTLNISGNIGDVAVPITRRVSWRELPNQ